ncbi:unnamed protein product [Linum tenue]|uniref:Uncharacterized protein n=1 Tax=Linum tenue TaxID=586396 RepID=A0AAV0NWV6_9ROSI|nr:unnamed protein product [Linum tenue]
MEETRKNTASCRRPDFDWDTIEKEANVDGELDPLREVWRSINLLSSKENSGKNRFLELSRSNGKYWGYTQIRLGDYFGNNKQEIIPGVESCTQTIHCLAPKWVYLTSLPGEQKEHPTRYFCTALETEEGFSRFPNLRAARK